MKFILAHNGQDMGYILDRSSSQGYEPNEEN